MPCTKSFESPETAAARCSESQLLAVPGAPKSKRARSVARVATATSMSRRLPMYLGVISNPLSSFPPITYWTAAHGESFQFGGLGLRSTRASSASSSA